MLNLTGSYQYPSSCGVKVALEHLEGSSSDRNWDSPKKEPCGRGWRMEEVQSQLGISFDGEGHGGGVLSRFSPASTLQSPSSVSHWLNRVRGNWQKLSSCPLERKCQDGFSSSRDLLREHPGKTKGRSSRESLPTQCRNAACERRREDQSIRY